MNLDTNRLSRGHWFAAIASLWLIVGVFQPFYSFSLSAFGQEASLPLSGWQLLTAPGDRTSWSLKISAIMCLICGLGVLGIVVARAMDLDLVPDPRRKVAGFGGTALFALATRIVMKPGGGIIDVSLGFGLYLCIAAAGALILASTMLEMPGRNEAPEAVAEALAVR
jgi:hypothetical protein